MGYGNTESVSDQVGIIGHKDHAFGVRTFRARPEEAAVLIEGEHGTAAFFVEIFHGDAAFVEDFSNIGTADFVIIFEDITV